jgi:hypothetical protein
LLAVLNDVQPDPTPSNIVAVLLLGIVPLTEQEMARTVEICSVSLHLRETSVDLLPPLARLALFMEIPSIVLDLLILHSEGAMVVALASQMICAVSTVVMSPLYTPCILRNWRKLQVACAQTLSRLGSPTGVPALLDAAVNGPRPVREAAEEALEVVMASFEAAAIRKLSADERRMCCRLLSHQKESLMLIALDLLQRYGDGDACPYVERLVRRARSPQVRERAEAVLSVLEALRDSARDAAQLLRAGSPLSQGDALLRASTDTGTPPEELLRATNEESSAP